MGWENTPKLPGCPLQKKEEEKKSDSWRQVTKGTQTSKTSLVSSFVRSNDSGRYFIIINPRLEIQRINVIDMFRS